ncbi:MAG: acyl-CoA thioester hydrolase [Polaribacter sp.]|jgi:acyl-CoA thioester hydrolase
MTFQETFKTRWSDFDANRHLRHTAYNDYAAEVRLRYFKQQGFTMSNFAADNLGPILFKEETSFFKEILMGADITINLKLKAVSGKTERWKLLHHFFNEKGELAAEIMVYGAWIDLEKRKLAIPSPKFNNLFSSLEKTADYEDIILKK